MPDRIGNASAIGIRWRTASISIRARTGTASAGMLLTEVITQAEARGFRQMVAVIGDSAQTASIALHRSLGFQPVGTFTNIGFKHGRWLDSVLMQRGLGEGASTLP